MYFKKCIYIYKIEDSKIGAAQFTEDTYIEEDFETELGPPNNSQAVFVESDIEKTKNELKEKINSYGIVNMSGSDLTGRPIALNILNKFKKET
jgi:hypothetical protein